MMDELLMYRMIALLLFMAGCASVVTTQDDYRARAVQVTRDRAAFDLGCAAQELNVTPLGDETFMTDAYEYQVIYGVTGCGTKASYLARCERTNQVQPKCSALMNSDQKPAP
jgi:hypothetical protein